ncbi:glycine receptor subunit alpha-3-like isoform X1 [Penaeus chinensis]|uniref:glycine receptor subunit alpha-3-like isoform X1 n=1 Tax=Penaeus chinensis TaxID=139456 RepID=UPI001FB7967B|nr:glycine receptor subunit alpha-3-like isoform X1 [Penaeus chinensis]
MAFRLWLSASVLCWLGGGAGAIKIPLGDLLNLNSYDGALRPNTHAGPTHINVTLFIDSISVDDKKQVIGISGELLQEWMDPNLQFQFQGSSFLTSVGLSGVSGASILSQVWRPDLVAGKELKAREPSSSLEFLRIKNDGHVVWMQRVHYSFPCHLDLQVYPLGSHKCVLKLHSLGYESNELQPQWKEDTTIDYSSVVMSHGYRLKGTKRSAKSVVIAHRPQRELQMEFDIESSGGWTVKHTVIPLVATVTCAYLAFFINIRGVCARMITCMMSLVTAAIFHESTYRNVPPSAQTMAVEVFTGTCLTFIFVATVESVVVDVLAHLPTKGRRSPPSSSFALEVRKDGRPDLMEERSGHKGPVAALWLDRCFRVLYPASFLAFNAVYWVLYN